MKTPFNTDVITSATDLYGREDLLESLHTSANMHINVQLIGTRRFGKTCLLRTMYNELSCNDSPCYPVYLDFKHVSSVVSKSSDVYNYIISVIFADLFKSGIIDKETLTFNQTIVINPNSVWSNIYSQVERLSSSDSLGLLQTIIPWFADLLGKPILLMIDEYEYLIKYSLSSPDDFFAIRNLSTETLPSGQRTLVFWVAGAETWEHISKVTGSGWGNTMHSPFYVDPLEKEDFLLMWNQESEKIYSEQKRNLLLSKAEFAWEKSGGVPFYGKLIGTEYLLKKSGEVDYTLLQTFFDEILKGNISREEKTILKDLATLPRKKPETSSLRALINKGLVRFDEEKNRHQITIGFLSDYLKTLDFMTATRKSATENLVDDICRLIENINSQNPRKMIFKPVNEELSLAIEMKKIVLDKDIMQTFSCAVYKMYLERSAGLSTFSDGTEKIVFGKNLPYTFSKNCQDKPECGMFARAVDRLRQTYIHLHDNSRPIKSQIDEAEMLSYFIGKTILPLKPEEYEELQMGVLKKFKAELEKMRDYVISQ